MDSFNAIELVAGDAAPAKSRRQLFNGFGALATLGVASLLSSCGSEESPLASSAPTPTGTPTPAPSITPVTDTDLLVLMMQLHYLQAEFYSRGIFGAPLAAALVTGSGTQGQVTGGTAVTITDPVLADMLREVAAEKIDLVVRLRAALGSSTPACPDINIAVDDAGVFTAYGRDAKVVTAPALYNVYASQTQFLLGAFILEDPVMSAWRGASPLMTSNANIDTAAGALASCAFHTGLIRSRIYALGAGADLRAVSPLRAAALLLSDLRDSYSPTLDDDRGVSTGRTVSSVTYAANTNGAGSEVDGADGEGEIYGRLPQLTVNTFYMKSSAGTSGGFFPSGLNGSIKNSVNTTV